MLANNSLQSSKPQRAEESAEESKGSDC